MTGKYMLHTEGDITPLNRIVRAATALLMLGYPMVVETNPLGIVALLPLMAIYPMFTAVVGWDPLLFIIETSRTRGRVAQLRAAGRFVLVLTGTVMIAATLMQSGELGWYALLALGAIVPVFIAILGEEPLQALLESSHQLRRVQGQHIDKAPSRDVDNFVMDENAGSVIKTTEPNVSHPSRKAA